MGFFFAFSAIMPSVSLCNVILDYLTFTRIALLSFSYPYIHVLIDEYSVLSKCLSHTHLYVYSLPLHPRLLFVLVYMCLVQSIFNLLIEYTLLSGLL